MLFKSNCIAVAAYSLERAFPPSKSAAFIKQSLVNTSTFLSGL